MSNKYYISINLCEKQIFLYDYNTLISLIKNDTIKNMIT